MRMKNKLFSFSLAAILLAFTATMMHYACTADLDVSPQETAAAAKKAAQRTTECFFDDVNPPVIAGACGDLTAIWVRGDSIFVVAPDINYVSRLIYDNTIPDLSVHADTLALGFVGADTFRVKAPAVWLDTYLNLADSARVWDARVGYN